jgi:flagellar hook-length control protein FliK
MPLPYLRAQDVTASRFVSDAQLTTAANQSEMHIAMQTDKLGAIELHARLSGDQVGATILVEKRDAHAALASELPALQQALSDKQLRVAQVALSQGSLSSTAGDAGSHARDGQRGLGQAPQSNNNTFWTENRTRTTAAWFIPEQTGVFNAQGRLSVQA